MALSFPWSLLLSPSSSVHSLSHALQEFSNHDSQSPTCFCLGIPISLGIISSQVTINSTFFPLQCLSRQYYLSKPYLFHFHCFHFFAVYFTPRFPQHFPGLKMQYSLSQISVTMSRLVCGAPTDLLISPAAFQPITWTKKGSQNSEKHLMSHKPSV